MPDLSIVTFASIPQLQLSRRDMVKSQGTRHLLGPDGLATPSIAADHVELPPGFVHMMHRHPHGEQLLLPLDGTIVLAEPGAAHEFTTGQLGVVPRGAWHEVRNESSTPVHAIVMFCGVPSAAEAGYVEWNPDSLAGTSGWVDAE